MEMSLPKTLKKKLKNFKSSKLSNLKLQISSVNFICDLKKRFTNSSFLDLE